MAILIAGIFGLSVTSLAAETYRWKDKDGKTHYGAVVPAEYADQPYDILNDAGMVIEHIEDTSIPLEVSAEKKIQQERAPLISEETRQLQTDRLLVIRYSSEEEILKALDMEVAQLKYDKNVINKSFEDTTIAIRGQISQAANQQRAGQPISVEQQKEIEHLYARRVQDEKKRSVMSNRESRIRDRYQAELERYRFLTSQSEESDQENEQTTADQAPTDNG